MRASSGFRAILIALFAVGCITVSSAARADSGRISLTVAKGGWFIGAQGGNGTLSFHGHHYPLTVGGLSAGLVFGGSVTKFQGSVSNIRHPSDVAGTYGAIGGGGALGVGAQVITLRNEKGAVLRLHGVQAGLQLNLDLSGLVINLQ
jgi:hypothetical protein